MKEYIDTFMPYMDKFDMTKEKKEEFIVTLAGLLQKHVDEAWEAFDN